MVSGRASVGSVNLQAAERAAAWCEYFRSHAEKLYSMRGSTYDTARLILKKIRSGKLSEHFTARDVYVKGWSGLTDAREVSEALETLVEHGFLVPWNVPKSGRRTVRHAIHPHCYDLERKPNDSTPKYFSHAA